MKTSDFDFDLPLELIANAPADPRDSARLLYINGFNLADYGMLDLPDLLKPTDVLVL